MRIVVFGPEKRVGAWVGDDIIDLNGADGRIPSSLLDFIETGPSALERGQRAIDQASRLPDNAVQRASGVKIHAPWPGRRIMMAGANFGAHAMGMDVGGDATIQDVVARILDHDHPNGGFGVHPGYRRFAELETHHCQQAVADLAARRLLRCQADGSYYVEPEGVLRWGTDLADRHQTGFYASPLLTVTSSLQLAI